MGKYDQSIKWLRERRELAVEDLRDFESGHRAMHDLKDGKLVDDTPAWVQRAKLDIERFDRLIAAYEAHEAGG